MASGDGGGDGTEPTEEPEMPAEEQSGTGRLTVLLIDAPLDDVSSVYVTVSAVEVHHRENGWITLTEEPATYDLLELQDGISATLASIELETGSYHELRLIVDTAVIVAGGESFPLDIPSGAETGIKLQVGFCVARGVETTITLDWDVAESLHHNNGRGYWMTPSISQVGSGGCEAGGGDESQAGDEASEDAAAESNTEAETTEAGTEAEEAGTEDEGEEAGTEAEAEEAGTEDAPETDDEASSGSIAGTDEGGGAASGSSDTDAEGADVSSEHEDPSEAGSAQEVGTGTEG